MSNYFEIIILLFVVITSINVLIVNNPVQSLLWLITTFAISSIFFMILGAELMSILVFMIYIGAIAVLFLFVIMMLNIKIIELRYLYLRYLSIGIIIICFFILEIILSIFFEFSVVFLSVNFYENWIINLNFNGNIFLMGSVIYNYNFVLFLILGLVLFVAMISSIVLLVNWNVKSSRLNVYNNLYFFNRRKIFFIK